MRLIEYEVEEHYADAPPEPFGHYLHDLTKPKIAKGDVIMLKWLDGSDAYRVRVELIRDGVLHVMAEHEPAASPQKGSADGHQG